MSTLVIRREFCIPSSVDFSLITGYISSVSSFADTGTASFDQLTRYNSGGFVDQYYRIITHASSSNDASIQSAGNTFISNNPGVNVLIYSYSVNEGA